MPARVRNLFGSIASFPALREAAFHLANGKRSKPGVAAFPRQPGERQVLRLERELGSGRYNPAAITVIEVFDPKHRVVSPAPFRDRVVHHAFCAVAEPIFERGFIFDSYANRKGKGTHRAVARYEKFRDRFRHVLRCDIYRYSPAIDHAILKRRRLACERTLDLADRIIDGSNPEEPVEIARPGALSDCRVLDNGPLKGYMTTLRIPANRFRLSRYRDTTESDAVQRQERQIVQSWLNLRDFLP